MLDCFICSVDSKPAGYIDEKKFDNYSINNSLKDRTQEEADTLLILYVVAVSRQGNTVHIIIFL